MVKMVKVSKKKVVIYARFSSDMQREESIDAQIRACKEFAEREGYEVIEIYYDEAISAKTDQRDDFQRMISDSKSGDFEIILVHKFNRFARNKFDSVFYKKRLADIGIKVVSVTQKIDDTPEGKMLEGILESMDEYYSANLALEVLKGMKENALKGKRTGGKPPLGYSYDSEGKLIPNDQAFLVRKIFDMYNEGYGKLLIANKLNEMGYRTQTGNEFAGRSVYDILKNEKYLGHYVYNLGDEEIKLPHFHEPIISQEVWDESQKVKKRKHKPRLNSNVIYSLTGKMRCGVCGDRYSGGGSKAGYGGKGNVNYYYVCNNKRYHRCSNLSVNKEKIESYLCQHILLEILNDEEIERIGDEFEKIAKEQEGNKPTISIEALNKEKKKLQAEKKKYLNLYGNERFTQEELDEEVDRVIDRIKAIDKQIQIASYTNEGTIKKEEAIKYLQAFRASYDNKDKHIVKALLDTFIDNLIVYKDRIDVTYKVDFSSFGGDKTPPDDEGGNGRHASPRPLLPTHYYKQTITRKELKQYKI